MSCLNCRGECVECTSVADGVYGRLSALRAEVEELRKERDELRTFRASINVPAGTDIKQFDPDNLDNVQLWLFLLSRASRAVAAEAEVAKLRKVADAAREWLKSKCSREPCSDCGKLAEAFDAALAGLGEPTPAPPSEPSPSRR